MSKSPITLIDPFKDIEYQYFDVDPDGDPDRAGDGIYYSVKGTVGWSGPWESEEEAYNEACTELFDNETRETYVDLLVAGYICVDEPGQVDRDTRWVKQTGSRFFRIAVRGEDVILSELFPNARGFAAKLIHDYEAGKDDRFLVHQGDDGYPVYAYGMVRTLVREAIDLAQSAPKVTDQLSPVETMAAAHETGFVVAEEFCKLVSEDRSLDDIFRAPTASELSVVMERLQSKIENEKLDADDDFRFKGVDLLEKRELTP